MVSSVLLLKLCIVWTLTAPRGTSYCDIYLLLVYSFLPAMYIQPQANPPRFSKSYVVCMHAYMYVFMYVCMDICVCMCVCMYVCMYVYMSHKHIHLKTVFLLK